MRSCLFITTGLFLLTAVVAYLIIRLFFLPSDIFESGKLSSPYLNDPVEIERNEFGMVTISTDDPNDLYFGLGFTHAREMLWHLQVVKWTVNAELSSVFGDYFLETDQMATMLTSDYTSEDSDELQNYVNGINSYIKHIKNRYPAEFTLTNTKPEKWDISDAQKYAAIMTWIFQTKWQEQLTLATANFHIPASLLPFIHPTDEIHVLDTEKRNAALWLIRNDRKLRDVLNTQSGVPLIRAVSSIENSCIPDAAFSLQIGTSRNGFWMPLNLNFSGSSNTLVTTPGLPIFLGGMNNQTLWLPDFDTISIDEIILEQQPDADSNRALIQLRDGSQSLLRFSKSETAFSLDDFDGFGILHPTQFSSNGISEWISFNDSVLNGQGLESNDFKVITFSELNSAIFTHGYPDNLAHQLTNEENCFLPEDRFSFTSISLGIDPKSQERAEIMALALSSYDNQPYVREAVNYLNNWNFLHERFAVGATLYEGLLHYLTDATLRNYLPDSTYSVISSYSTHPLSIGEGLVDALGTQLDNPAVFSPIDDSFLLRRFMELSVHLENKFGSSTTEWRWGNLTSINLWDNLLCGSPENIHFPGQRICTQVIGTETQPGSGGRQGLFSVRFSFDNEPAVNSETTHIIFLDDREQIQPAIFSLRGLSGQSQNRLTGTSVGTWQYMLPAGLLQGASDRTVLILEPEK